MVARSAAQRSYDVPLNVDPSEVQHDVTVIGANRSPSASGKPLLHHALRKASKPAYDPPEDSVVADTAKP